MHGGARQGSGRKAGVPNHREYVVRYKERGAECKLKTFGTLAEARAFFRAQKEAFDCFFVELMSIIETWTPSAGS